MPTVDVLARAIGTSGSGGGYLTHSLFLEKQRVIDEFVGRDRNALSRASRTTAPFQYSSSLGLPSRISRSIEAVPSAATVSKTAIVSATIDAGNATCRDAATSNTSFMHRSTSRRVSGLARIAPIGALLTAPTPPNDVMVRKFSQSALCISGGISTVTPVFRNASCNCAAWSLRRLSSSPNLIKLEPPMLRIRPGGSNPTKGGAQATEHMLGTHYRGKFRSGIDTVMQWTTNVAGPMAGSIALAASCTCQAFTPSKTTSTSVTSTGSSVA